MSIPAIFRVLIVTLSDRASRGEYRDLSGPRAEERLIGFFELQNWKYTIERRVIPDETDTLRALIEESARNYDLVFTTGGTGIGPRDITVDTVKPLLDKEIPGIMEYIRVRYGTEKPNALLSRGVAGIRGNTLIFTLPGSLKAVDEYLDEIAKSLAHAIYMLHGEDIPGKH